MDTFRIGLTFAGAVSGGAYTAGVVDFLVEALNAWYAAKADPGRDDVPEHEVSIDVITGTSAGSVTAALMLGALRGPVSHVSAGAVPPKGAPAPMLFDTWVNGLSIDALLKDDDLKANGNKVVSLLDSTVLGTLGDKMITTVPAKFAPRPQWLNEKLKVIFCTTNVHGVPYRIPMAGVGSAHDMWQHADYGQFVYSDTDPGPLLPGVCWVDRMDPTNNTPASPGKAAWETLRDMALASSAFPIGLAPRLVEHAATEYNARQWPVPKGPPECCAVQSIATPWDNQQQPAKPARFLSVDGGQANNESFELARQVLADGPCKHNDRGELTVDRAVILLDPFLDPWKPQDYQKALNQANIDDGRPDVLGLLKPLLGSMLTQCRFKREELALAQDETVYSRYLLAPTRIVNGAVSHDADALASGGLGAFSGFLDRELRVHDYLLGRHNAREFLLKDFAVPLEHAMLKPCMARYQNPVDLGQYTHTDTDPVTGATVRYASIIPLMKALRDVDEDYPPWPALSQDFVQNLEKPVKKRLGKVVSSLLSDVGCWLFRWFGGKIITGKVVKYALGAICCDLRKWNLISGKNPPPADGTPCPGCPYK